MIAIKNLNFYYQKKKPIFKNMDMHLESGHIYGLLGKNGAGKSTLLKNIAGLVFPNDGDISILGHDPRKRAVPFLQEVTFIPEEFYLPDVKSDKYLKANAGFYPNFDDTYFQQLVQEFDIPMDQKLSAMSYGQKKKYIISFGLAARTRLVIMDEPTNGLDIPSKIQFRKVMASALTDDRCFIISTHQVRDLDNLIDAVIILDQNKIVLNQSIYTIGDRIQFKKMTTLDADVLYAEPTLGGHYAIVANTDAADSKVDLELLFNGILNEREKITNLIEA